jgi:hypothetical protein
LCTNHFGVTHAVHPQDTPAPRVQIADHIAHRILGHGDFHRHDGFEEHGICLYHPLLEAHGPRDLEGHIR